MYYCFKSFPNPRSNSNTFFKEKHLKPRDNSLTRFDARWKKSRTKFKTKLKTKLISKLNATTNGSKSGSTDTTKKDKHKHEEEDGDEKHSGSMVVILNLLFHQHL